MPTPPLPATTPLFGCPECRAPIRKGDLTCQHCGINLALAATLAERSLLAQVPAGLPPEPAEPASTLGSGSDVPRFGEFLVGQGYITPDELAEGLRQQERLQALGTRQTIGQTLLSLNSVSRDELDQANVLLVSTLQQALEASAQALEQRVRGRDAALTGALLKLSELAEVKAAFIANLSHELRAPLSPIKGFSDLLRAGRLGSLAPAQQEAVEAISRSATRLEAAVNHLVQLAANPAGGLAINQTRVCLPELAGPLWDYFGPHAEAQGVRLQADWPADLPAMRADGEKVYWVLFQLIDNALKFTPAGGSVTLAGHVVPATPDGAVRLAVADTGAGIEPERQASIFEPAPPPPDGAGPVSAALGLPLVRRVVEAHGAHLELTSTPGQGSTFSFDLPLASQP